MNDYAARVAALDDKVSERLADVAHEAVEVIVPVAVEVLEDSLVVEAESAADKPLADSLGLERSHADNYIVILLFRLELPRDASNLAENGGLDIGQMELERTFTRVLVVNGLRRDTYFK